MCTNGVNNSQLVTMLEMTSASVELNASWTKELAHLAGPGHAELASGAELERAASLLKEVRRILDAAAAEAEAAPNFSGVEVRSV